GRRVGFAGVRDRMTEASRHALTAAVDLVDVPSDDLLLEERVRHLHGVRAWEEDAGEEDVREDDEDEEEPDPSRRPWRGRRGRPLAPLWWILTPRGRARFLSHGAVGRHPFQSTRRGPGPPGSPGERDTHLRCQIGSLAREAEPIVQLEQGMGRDLPLRLRYGRDLVLFALDGQDRPPSRGKALQVLESVLAERDLPLLRLVLHGCACGERAEAEAAGQPESLDQLPVLGADDLAVSLEGKDGFEVAPELGLLVVLLPPPPPQLRLGVPES